MRRLAQCSAQLLCVLTMAACASVHERVGVDTSVLPEAEEQLHPGGRIMLLEPQVDYSFHSFSHDPVVLPGQKSLIRDTLLGSAARRLPKQGFIVDQKRSNARRTQRAFLARRLAGNYSELMSLRQYTDDPLPSLGPMVNRLTAANNTEWLLISRFSGVQKSLTQHRKDRLTASMRALVSVGRQKPQVLPIQSGNLELALVDGVSGQVIWRAHTAGRPEQLEGMVERLLDTLPVHFGN